MPELNYATHGESNILVVDDNPANVLFLEKLLAKAGYTNVQSTTSPEDAKQIALFSNPDLVILDLHMPGISGYELLQRLRMRREKGSYLPILVFTADSPAKLGIAPCNWEPATF